MRHVKAAEGAAKRLGLDLAYGEQQTEKDESGNQHASHSGCRTQSNPGQGRDSIT